MNCNDAAVVVSDTIFTSYDYFADLMVGLHQCSQRAVHVLVI